MKRKPCYTFPILFRPSTNTSLVTKIKCMPCGGLNPACPQVAIHSTNWAALAYENWGGYNNKFSGGTYRYQTKCGTWCNNWNIQAVFHTVLASDPQLPYCVYTSRHRDLQTVDSIYFYIMLFYYRNFVLSKRTVSYINVYQAQWV
jgi:Fe-S-cluster-containing hydrogenase component 2